MDRQPQARKRPFGLYMVIILMLLNAVTLALVAILDAQHFLAIGIVAPAFPP